MVKICKPTGYGDPSHNRNPYGIWTLTDERIRPKNAMNMNNMNNMTDAIQFFPILSIAILQVVWPNYLGGAIRKYIYVYLYT